MKLFQNKGENKPTKVKKIKRKRTREEKKLRNRRILNAFVILIIVLGITGLTVAGTIGYSIISSSTITIDEEDFVSHESTAIYDRHGDLVTRIGENRVNITYEDIPQVLIDAFISVEDSRFFEHPGFDIPRFTKAFLENIQSMSFEQGGSTFTMQMIKNTKFVTEEQLAEKSIPRKVQEIYFSLQIEKLIPKKRIFELYINKINFGGPARGAEAAAEYYFNKSAKDLTLSEAAMLAGVINLPNDYNPYYNIDWATGRRDNTLSLMEQHGYITEEERIIASRIKVEDLLVGEAVDLSTAISPPLQSYIDEVIKEAQRLTGDDPYLKAMNIYTAMDPITQAAADAVIREESVWFPDPYMQTGFAVVSNSTGEIVALGAGRGRTGQRTFSFATDARKQPGSSIKVIIDYALGFEYAGISTSHTELDDRTTWLGTSVGITNATNTYIGDVSIQRAVSASLNVPAVKVLRKVVGAVGNEKVIEFLKQIGFDEHTAEYFNEQYAIGGSDLVTSPLQMAAAQAMLFNNGVYMQPHTIRSIEYIDGKTPPFVPTYTGTQVISPAAAWLIADIMEGSVSNPVYVSGPGALRKSYPVYAKSGTSDWSTDGLKYGIPRGANKDNWINGSTSQFTIATWIGYDTPIAGADTYLTNYKYRLNIPGQIGSLMLDALQKSYGTPGPIVKPGDVGSIRHVKGTWPYMAVPAWCPDGMAVSGSVKAGTANVVPWPTPSIDALSSFSSNVMANSNTSATIWTEWAPLSATMPTVIEPTSYLLASGRYGTREFSKTWVDGVVRYQYDVVDASGNTIYSHASTTPVSTRTIDLSSLPNGTHTLTIKGYYSYSIAPVHSNFVDTTVTVTVSRPVTPPPVEPPIVTPPTP